MTDHIDDAEVEETTVTKSCGNVFADLGLADPEERMAKAELALAITRRIRACGLTQDAAAQQLGTDQGKVSAIMRGRLAGFNYDRLLRFLNLLGCSVTIEVQTPSEDMQAEPSLRACVTARIAA